MHLTESELAASAHGESAEHDSTHLTSCPECTARLRALRDDDREVAALLSALDHRAPRYTGAAFLHDLHRRRRRIGAIAAGLAFCAAGAAAALPNSPLHQVLVRAFSKTGTGASTTVVLSKRVPNAPKAGVAFLPGSSVDVRFSNPQPGGRLRILLVDGFSVSATADGDAAFSIHQSQLDVTDRGIPMTFTLEIPRTMSEVAVRVGGEVIFEKRGGVVTSSLVTDSSGVYTFSFGGSASGPARAR